MTDSSRPPGAPGSTAKPGAEPPAIAAGMSLGRYQILERLGAGGMGEVYRAEDSRLHRPVAIKVLRAAAACVEEEKSRLLREARAASALNHPNIAVIYEVEETVTPAGPLCFLAMEYVAGKSLAELARTRPLALDEILDVVRQTAEALAEAHIRGVVHRDIKPSNLIVTEAGRVKVVDFGLARLAPLVTPDAPTWSQAALADAAELSGTLQYMAPEQALGRPVDGRSDLFSLGVVLYELLAGRLPFAGRTVTELLDAILHLQPQQMSSRFLDPRLPQLERIVGRMLAKDPAARYATADEVVQELQALRPEPTPAAAGALIVAVAGFANLTGTGEDEWLGTGLTETIMAALKDVEGVEVLSRDRILESLRQIAPAASGLASEQAVLLGRRVGARWVVGGAFQRSGGEVRVTAQVVDVATGTLVRAGKCDGRIEEIFAVQDELVANLVSGLRTHVAALTEGEDTRVVEAYEALAKGLLNVRAGSYESLDRALLFFERAVALDPRYARAHLELGAAYAQKADYLLVPELHERATISYQRALDLQPRLARGWRELGASLAAMGRIEEGLANLDRALLLAPEDAMVLAGKGRVLFLGLGRFAEAAALYERAVERNPQAGWYWLQLAHCGALLRDFARGERAARRAAELQEAFLSGQQGFLIVGAYMRLAHLAALQGRHAEAAEHCQREMAFLQSVDHALRSRILVELSMRLGGAHLQLGETERAQGTLRGALEHFARRVALGADDPFTRYYAAGVHALLGEKDLALAALEKAAATRRAFIVARARIEPEFESLRGEERFERLLAGGPSP